jgi:hypothetical protein
MNLRYIALFIVVSTFVVAARQDDQSTIPEIVRRQSASSLLQTRQRELFPQSFEEMVPQSDLVLHGIVAGIKSYLSSDQRDVYTDYAINPLRVIRQRSTAVEQRPGQPASVVLKRWGGEITVEGVKVIAEDLDLRQFRLGEQLLLVLVYDNADGKCRLPSPVSGAFLVVDERVQPLVQHPVYAPLRGLSIQQVEAMMHRLIG